VTAANINDHINPPVTSAIQLGIMGETMKSFPISGTSTKRVEVLSFLKSEKLKFAS
jgi:hypothetical protein